MEIRLHLDQSNLANTGRAAFTPPPQPLWAEWESAGMVAALRFHSRLGAPVLSEVRIFPAERDRGPGTWSDNVDSVPPGGLSTTAIHNFPLGTVRDAAIVRMSNPNHPVWEEAGFERWEQWWDNVAAAGIEAERATPRPRPGGRPPLSDRHWAEVALHYVTAAAAGKPIHEYVRDQMAEGDETLPTTTWVSEARKRGFLTPAAKPGQSGGTLTSKARAVLTREGLVPPHPSQVSTNDNTQHRGETR